MSVMASVAAGVVLLGGQGAPPLSWRDPESKGQERERFHRPDVSGQPVGVRLAAFEQRKRMLAETPLGGIAWRNVGSEVFGGRVVDIAVPRGDKRQILVAFATGGLWRTVNEGQTWTPLFDGQSAFGIGDVDVSGDGRTIWVGTGEANSQRTSYSGTGVYVSRDGGETWSRSGLEESHHIGRVKIDPRNPQVVYVAALGPLYSQGGQRGLYRTRDGGRSWDLILRGDERTGCIDVVIDPRDSRVLYASMWERDRRAWNLLESGPGSAVYKSTDAGRTWRKLAGLPSGEVMGRTALAVSPSRPDTVYAFMDNQGPDAASGSYDEFRPGGELTLNRFRRMSETGIRRLETAVLAGFLERVLPAPGEGRDARGAAREAAERVKSGDLGLEELAGLMRQRDPAVFDRDINDAEVWRSDDGGRTWRKTREDMGSHGGYYWNEVVVNPRDAEEVYTLGVLLYRSRDGGRDSSVVARRNHVDHHALWIDPDGSGKMLNGNDGGIYVSYDSGESWTHWNNLPVGQFTTVAVDDKTPYNIYGGTQDNGTQKGPSNYRPGVSALTAWTMIGGGDGSAIQVDPRNGGDVVYIASQFGAHSAVNQTTGQRWNVRAADIPGQPDLRYNWISPILISPHHPDIVYLGAQRVFRSFDQGRSYQPISGDLTRDFPNGDVPFSTLTALAESPLRFGRIYAGADDGSLQTTGDGGVTWRDIRTPAPERWVTRIVASRYREGRVYVTQNGYRQNEWTAMVWVSEDFGETWRSIAGGLPAESVNTIREDPVREDVLYVGTMYGVYASLDRGTSWVALGSGMPGNPVHDLVIQPRAKEIVAATHGRSVWVASVARLQDLTPEVRAKEFHAFVLDVPTGRASWPYDRTPPFTDGSARDRRVTTEFWTLGGGKGRLALVGPDGVEATGAEVEVRPGLNTLSLSLLLRDGDRRAAGVFGDPDDPGSALADPFAARRPEYVAAGSYQLRLTVEGRFFDQAVTIR